MRRCIVYKGMEQRRRPMKTEFGTMQAAVDYYSKFGYAVIHYGQRTQIMFDSFTHVRLEKHGWSGKVRVREI
jgi:hypothetical protein